LKPLLSIGAGCSFYFFLTGLRQSHGAEHYSLGLPRRFQDGVLFSLSACMLASMHAVQVSHLHHHRHCLEVNDAEGSTAHLRWWQAILLGPAFIWRLHKTAWGLASGLKRRWMIAEVLAIAGLVGLTVAAPSLHALRWHVSAMIIGECLTRYGRCIMGVIPASPSHAPSVAAGLIGFATTCFITQNIITSRWFQLVI
jgi:hypothetical protein